MKRCTLKDNSAKSRRHTCCIVLRTVLLNTVWVLPLPFGSQLTIRGDASVSFFPFEVIKPPHE